MKNNILAKIKNNIAALLWCVLAVLLGSIFLQYNVQYFYVYLGFILALFVFFVVDYFRKPNFKIIFGAINEALDGKWRFLHVNVINLDWPIWFFIFRRNVAYNTTAEISFMERFSDKTIFTIKGRWSSNLEPIKIETNQLSFDPDKAEKGGVVDISPSKDLYDLREGKLVVAMKHNNDDNAYGFNDYSYTTKDFKVEGWKLNRGEYDIKITIKSSRHIYTKMLALKNLGVNLTDFIITEYR